MKKLNYLACNLRGALIVGTTLLAYLTSSAWDEVGPAVKGMRQNLSDISPREEVTVPVKENGLWGFVSKDGKVTIKPKYQEIGAPQYYQNKPTFADRELDRSLIPVKLNGLWGFVGQNGKEAIKPQYEYVGTFTTVRGYDSLGHMEYNGKCLVSKNGRYFYINHKGKEVESLVGLSDVFDIDGYTFANQNGTIKMLSDYNPGCTYEDKGKFAYIKTSKGQYYRDKNNKTMYDVKELIGPDQSVAVVKVSEEDYKLLGNNGFLSEKPFRRHITFTEGSAQTPRFYGLYSADNTFTCVSVDSQREMFKTDKTIKGWFGDKYFRFYEPGDESHCGIMDASGAIVVPTIYSSLVQGNSGNIVAEKDGKFGFITPANQELVPLIYNSVEDFGDGRVQVSDGATIGILYSSSGKWQLPLGKYSGIGKRIWKDRALWVKKGDKWGVSLVDLSREVLPPVYTSDELSVGFKTTHDNKLFTVHIERNGTVSVVDYYGKTIIPLGRYTGIKGYAYEYIAVMKGKKMGLVSRETGKQIVAPIHDGIVVEGGNKILAIDNMNSTHQMAYIYSTDGRLIHKESRPRNLGYGNQSFLKKWFGSYFNILEFTL